MNQALASGVVGAVSGASAFLPMGMLTSILAGGAFGAADTIAKNVFDEYSVWDDGVLSGIASGMYGGSGGKAIGDTSVNKYLRTEVATTMATFLGGVWSFQAGGAINRLSQ